MNSKINSGKKRRPARRVFFFAAVFACAVLSGLFLWKASAEPGAYFPPAQEKRDISGTLEQEALTEDDYRFLYAQTGLGPAAVEQLRAQGRIQEILRIQDMYYMTPEITCEKNSPVSWEERITPGAAAAYAGRLAALQDGDILITPCSHTFGWRNGHAAVVVDARAGLTVESVVLGKPSEIQEVSKWERFPTVIVLRLKGAGEEERRAVARYAGEEKQGIPYGFFEEILEHLAGPAGRDTHCSHLVWETYLAFGYDLDADGGICVTPRDIAESPLLEAVQVYGTDYPFPDTRAFPENAP